MTAFIAQAVIFFLIFFLGLIGNSIVLYVLLRQTKPWSITATYLFNLAIADTLFVCFLPFWGHYHLNELVWRFGTSMCKAAGTMTNINMYASIFFLTAISLDRWAAIVHATRMNQRRSTAMTRRICVLIWTASLILCSPSILFRTVRTEPVQECNQSDSTGYKSNITTSASETSVSLCVFFIPSNVSTKLDIMGGMEFFRSLVGFIIPSFIIIFCYAKIVWIVKRKVINRRVRKDKVAKLAAFVISAFIFCWTPYHVMNLYSALGGWWRLFAVDPCIYNSIKPFTICLAYANSCINPIVYAFTTSKFQDNMREICSSDKSPRPYRMVLTNPNDDRTSKTLAFALTSKRNNANEGLKRNGKILQQPVR